MTLRTPRYKLNENFRRTKQGVELFIPAGTVIEPLQEVISYTKRTHRVQFMYNDESVWVHKKLLRTLR